MTQALWVELESVIAQNQLTVESIVKVALEEQVKVVHVVTDNVEEGQAGRLACKVIENRINHVLIRNSTGQHNESLEVIKGPNHNKKKLVKHPGKIQKCLVSSLRFHHRDNDSISKVLHFVILGPGQAQNLVTNKKIFMSDAQARRWGAH